MPFADPWFEAWKEEVYDALFNLGDAWGDDIASMERLVYLAIAMKRETDEGEARMAA